jgi:hypothetical protein
VVRDGNIACGETGISSERDGNITCGRAGIS